MGSLSVGFMFSAQIGNLYLSRPSVKRVQISRLMKSHVWAASSSLIFAAYHSAAGPLNEDAESARWRKNISLDHNRDRAIVLRLLKICVQFVSKKRLQGKMVVLSNQKKSSGGQQCLINSVEKFYPAGIEAGTAYLAASLSPGNLINQIGEILFWLSFGGHNCAKSSNLPSQ